MFSPLRLSPRCTAEIEVELDFLRLGAALWGGQGPVSQIPVLDQTSGCWVQSRDSFPSFWPGEKEKCPLVPWSQPAQPLHCWDGD